MKTTALSPFALLVLTLACAGSPERPSGAAPLVPSGEGGADALDSGPADRDDPTPKPQPTPPAAGGAGASESDSDEAAAGDGGAASEPAEPFCGDGIVHAGEMCDDGNDVRGDQCNPDCLESGFRLKSATLVLPDNQYLRDMVIVGDLLFGVGVSWTTTDPNKLFVTADITASPLVLEGTVEGDPTRREFFNSITSDGEMIYAAGLTGTDAGNEDGLLESRSLSVSLDWDRKVDGTQHVDDYMCGIAMQGSNLIAVGTTTNVDTGEDLVYGTFFTSNQQEPVTTTVASDQTDECGVVEALGDDDAVIVGKQYLAEGGSELLVRRVDAAMGIVWTKTFPIRVNVNAVATGPDEQIAIVGSIRDDGDPPSPWDSWVMLLDGSGKKLWAKRIEHGGNDTAEGVAIDPENGDIVLVGARQDLDLEGTPSDPYIQRLDPSGTERWFSPVWATPHNDGAETVLIAHDGTLWVGGYWAVGNFQGVEPKDAWVGQFAP